MIIFLDDDSHRTKLFKQNISPDIRQLVKTCKTAQECIELIEQAENVYILFLDHDLGGEVWVDSEREDCGMEVVRWIEVNQPPIRQIIVHTMNDGAAYNMVKKLKAAQYNAVELPFETELLTNLQNGNLT